MTSSETLEPNVEAHLKDVLRRGTAILFTGAGFSAGTKNRLGNNLPTSRELTRLLWDVAFGESQFEEESALGDVFDVALARDAQRTKELLFERLTLDADKLPSWYESYFRIPWYRMYTLNVDDLAEVCARKFHLPFDLKSVSAIGNQLPPISDCSMIHLNGKLSEYPKITFSPLQYGSKMSRFDPAYDALSREIYSHPVVFIGTDLDEPSLWSYLALRGERTSFGELRPRSFLVSPTLSRARAAMLEGFNIKHVALSAQEFGERYISSVASANLQRPSYIDQIDVPFENVGLKLDEKPYAPADFLLGREPTWSDINSGFAVRREFEAEVFEDFVTSETRLLLLTGTAGSGKSTTALRLSMSLQASGRHVLWLKEGTSSSVTQIRNAAEVADARIVFIDRCERFGDSSIRLIQQLLEINADVAVIAVFASGAFDELNVFDSLREFEPAVVTIPPLGDGDITSLIDALDRATRLGKLAGLSPQEQFDAFRKRAGRQLLVAMLEATSDKRFEDKISDECHKLSSDLSVAYTVVALATASNYPLTLDDILLATSDVTSVGLEVVNRLVRQGLILRISDGRYAARHHVIATQVIAHFKAAGQLAEAIERLAFVLATQVTDRKSNTPAKRLLQRLTSHTYVRINIPSVVQARRMYEQLEPLLRDQPHYMLQRGSYELECGDIGLAENFLAQARGLSKDSYMIESEWAYLMMKKACAEPLSPTAHELFAEALEKLRGIIAVHGFQSPNSYVILGEQAINWCGRAVLTFDEKRRLLEDVQRAFKDGSRFHYGNRQFVNCRERVYAVYLSLSL